MLLNGRATELPAIHVRSALGGDPFDLYVLDDEDNPIVLRGVGRATGSVVQITFPTTAATPPIEEQLEKEARAEIHGIYFDFGKATIRPESERVLREIAGVLGSHADWRVAIEGHTDDVGGDAANLDLSQRRAAAVREALVAAHGITAARLSTTGFGASRPKASNETLQGRARNRRVELVRR